MDIASLIGIISGWVFIILSIFLTVGNFAGVMSFVDPPSIMVVLGGASASVLIAYPLPDILGALKAAKLVFNPPKLEPAAAIDVIIRLANLARKEGILALEESAKALDDSFLEKGIMLIVDGTDPELTRSIMETELVYIGNRHSNVKAVWEFFGSVGPAWGMIGTLIGLILMLQSLSDPSSIGPKMSVALVTTFYGTVLANFFANPFANKLKIYSDEEALIKEVLIEGMLSIQAGENPRIIEEKLKSFLAPGIRDTVQGTGAGAGER